MGSSERCSTDEVDSVAKVPAQEGKEVRDEMVAFDLFIRDSELLSNSGFFVDIHCRAQVSARFSDAVRFCSVASACRRSLSLRS